VILLLIPLSDGGKDRKPLPSGFFSHGPGGSNPKNRKGGGHGSER
jgi:hypothetical protein